MITKLLPGEISQRLSLQGAQRATRFVLPQFHHKTLCYPYHLTSAVHCGSEGRPAGTNGQGSHAGPNDRFSSWRAGCCSVGQPIRGKVGLLASIRNSLDLGSLLMGLWPVLMAWCLCIQALYAQRALAPRKSPLLNSVAAGVSTKP